MLIVKAIGVLESSKTVIKETHEFDELMLLRDEYCHAQRELEKAQAAVRSSDVSEHITRDDLLFLVLTAQNSTRLDAVNERNAKRESLVRIGENLAAAKQKVQELESTQQHVEQALDSLGVLVWVAAIDQSNLNEAAIDAALNAHRKWKDSLDAAVQQVNQSALENVDRSASQLIAVAMAWQEACRKSTGLYCMLLIFVLTLCVFALTLCS